MLGVRRRVGRDRLSSSKVVSVFLRNRFLGT
jgi:hypothetical protein